MSYSLLNVKQFSFFWTGSRSKKQLKLFHVMFSDLLSQSIYVCRNFFFAHFYATSVFRVSFFSLHIPLLCFFLHFLSLELWYYLVKWKRCVCSVRFDFSTIFCSTHSKKRRVNKYFTLWKCDKNTIKEYCIDQRTIWIGRRTERWSHKVA
jgi:hypothetical protein